MPADNNLDLLTQTRVVDRQNADAGKTEETSDSLLLERRTKICAPVTLVMEDSSP